MNPDFPYNKTTDTTTWTIKNGDKVISFKLYDNLKVGITGTGAGYDGENKIYLIKAARNMWDEYMRQGFRIINKCINHDMKKFHKEWYDIENNKNDVQKIHDAELQEMRIDPKDFFKKTKKEYTDNWEYALRA